MAETYDLFISYATEDRESVARPLMAELQKQGLRVWIDFKEIGYGDLLRDRINDGLRDSRFGVVILSPDYLRKHWTRNELGALLDPDKQGRRLLIVRHRIAPAELASTD
ncbi:MAG TPA: toll/interleukin-1 receptor domain-containing protein, partial [Verrucomicrobiota bacterium]|nr:molecular chaperone Tir [Verrucomicrobiales bacterium]HRI15742.1 toll/interleukin-1 receptor domain-containing protein [Verrucomicrobiota bacterium]